MSTCVEYLIKGSQTYFLYGRQASEKERKITPEQLCRTLVYMAEGKLMNTVVHTIQASSKKFNKTHNTGDDYRFSVGRTLLNVSPIN